jgi:MarR family transcriptional regulator, 2-MHQ and catechol-resistance regulon repressor
MGSHYKGTADEIRALSAYIKFARAYDAVRTRLDCLNISGDLTQTQFGVLETLYHLGSLHQNDLSEKLLISKSNVVAVIDKLEKQHYVKRQRSSEDRRYIFIHLTQAGQDIIESLLPAHVAAIVNEMSCLTADEQDEFGRLCRKIGLKQVE